MIAALPFSDVLYTESTDYGALVGDSGIGGSPATVHINNSVPADLSGCLRKSRNGPKKGLNYN